MKFFIKDFFSKCDQIRSFLRIWSHLLKKFLMENLIFCAMIALFLFMKEMCRFWLLKCTRSAIIFTSAYERNFKVRNEHHYTLTQNSQFSKPLVKSVYRRTKSLSYLSCFLVYSQKFTKMQMV